MCEHGPTLRAVFSSVSALLRTSTTPSDQAISQRHTNENSSSGRDDQPKRGTGVQWFLPVPTWYGATKSKLGNLADQN
jgi:hypothetical protein